jgi:pimeloyl-ACP methyl ester carboxylesterase
MPSASVNGTTLAYSEWGPAYGPPIVSSHSLFLEHAMFNTHAAFFYSL